MKTILVTLILAFISYTLSAKVRTIKIANASDSTIRVAVYISASPNQLGNAVSAVVTLTKGKEWSMEKKFDSFVFINSVLFRSDGVKILVESHLNKDESPSTLYFNISNVKTQSIDQEEVGRMNQFLNEQIALFRTKNNIVIQTDDNAFAAIQEYLGSIAVIDTAKLIADSKRIKKLITARQLGITNSINFSGGRTINNSFRISKTFSMSNNAKFPGIFDADLDFKNSELIELKYSIVNFGSILYQSDKNAVDLLKAYDDSTTEPVFSSLASTIENCPTCTIFQITRVLSFEGISILGKRFKKSDFAINGSAGSVVTSDAAFSFEDGNEYSDMTSSKVIAISAGTDDLSTSIFTTIIAELDKEIKKIKGEKSNTESVVKKMDQDIIELEAVKLKYNGFISKAKTKSTTTQEQGSNN